MTFQLTHKLFAILALVVTVLSVTATATLTTLAALSNSKTVQNYGTVKAVNVGVYWDSNCTNTTSTVNWGMLSPGTSSNATLYVRNEGNVALKLSLTTQNWNPVNASNYMGLAWNRQAQTVNASSVLTATLTLSVFSNVTGITSFSFDMVIAGTEQ
jgi:hypothetical protein